MKHFDENSKVPIEEIKAAKELYRLFLKDCKGIVERCNVCLKRKEKIYGYKYEICICDKVTKTIQNSNREIELNINQEDDKNDTPEAPAAEKPDEIKPLDS